MIRLHYPPIEHYLIPCMGNSQCENWISGLSGTGKFVCYAKNNTSLYTDGISAYFDDIGRFVAMMIISSLSILAVALYELCKSYGYNFRSLCNAF